MDRYPPSARAVDRDARAKRDAEQEARLNVWVCTLAWEVLAHALGRTTCAGLGVELIAVHPVPHYDMGYAVMRTRTGRTVRVVVYLDPRFERSFVTTTWGYLAGEVRGGFTDVKSPGMSGDQVSARLGLSPLVP